MKKTILTLFVAMTAIVASNSQTIEMEKVFGGYKFTQNGNTLSMSDLMTITETQKDAHKLIKSARTKNTIASILGGIGGALIGFPIGTAIGGGDPNWVLAGIGAGVIGVAIPISISSGKKAKQAVEIYNSNLQPTSFYRFEPEFTIITNGTGIGINMKF